MTDWNRGHSEGAGAGTQCLASILPQASGSLSLTHYYLSPGLSETQMAKRMAKSRLESQVQSGDSTITEASICKSLTTHQASR